MKKLTLFLKKLVFPILTMVIFGHCERDIFPQEYRNIYGNWTLRSISGGFTGGWREPKFDILTIQHGMSFYIYRNDTLLSMGTIKIISEASDHIEADFISKENYLGIIGSKSIRLSNDTLVLSDNCADCYSSLFVRNEIYSNPTYSQTFKTLDFLEITNYPIGHNKYCNSVYFQSESLGFLTCSDGSILKSDDGGKNWRQVETNNKLPLYGISFISDLIGFAIGGESGCSGSGCKVPGYLMLKTLNGGESWDSVPLPYKMADLKMIKFYSSNFGIAIGTGAKLLTRDGGQTWLDFSSAEMKMSNNLYILNENIAFLSGSKGQLFKTSDGGTSWQYLPYNSSYYIQSIMFTNELTGYISFYNALLKTSDGGLTWREIENGPRGASLISFTSENNGVVFGSRTYASSKWDIWDSYFNIMINGKWYGDSRVTSHSLPFCLDSKTFYTITWDNKISKIKLKN